MKALTERRERETWEAKVSPTALRHLFKNAFSSIGSSYNSDTLFLVLLHMIFETDVHTL